MSGKTEPLEKILNRAADGEQLALLQLSRRVTKLLRELGAYSVEKDWSVLTQEIASAAVDSQKNLGRRTSAESQLESTTKNIFWGCILDLMSKDHIKATNLFFPTVRRLLSHWDGSRRLESQWDDIVQDTAYQLWKLWAKGGVEKPWSMICTVAKRRFLDRVRSLHPTDEIDDKIEAREDNGPELKEFRFADQVLEVLEDAEREIIVKMDLEGQTRAEIAADLGMTEGQVLSLRRAGLRRIWRWLGTDLPPRLREVWEESFKGASRARPEQIAVRLGLGTEDVEQRLSQARSVLGL